MFIIIDTFRFIIIDTFRFIIIDTFRFIIIVTFGFIIDGNDNKYFISSDDQSYRGTYELIHELRTDIKSITIICCSLNTKYIVSGHDDGVTIWNMRRYSLFCKFGLNKVCAMCFSPDSKQLVCGTDDFLVKIWDVGTKTLINSLSGLTRGITAICYSKHIVNN